MKALLAQTDITNPALSDSLQSLSGAQFLQGLVQVFVSIGLAAGGIFFFFQFITGGINWINSGGDKQKLEAARERLMNAIIGLIILLSIFAIITFIQQVLGFDILLLQIPSID